MIPEERLANAIIEQAARDYRGVLRGKKETPKCNRTELERFFKSQWLEQLTTVDGEYLMRSLREDEAHRDKKSRVYISMQGELNKKRRRR